MISLLIYSWADFEAIIRSPPHSLWFIFVVSIGVSFISTLLNKVLVDHNRLNRMQEVISSHQKEKKELMKMAEENPKRYAKQYIKYQRRDKSVQQMQQKMSLQRLKPTCFTFIPIILFFYVIRNIYTADSGIQLCVALPPMNPMDDFPDFINNMLRSEFFSAVGNIYVENGFIGFTAYYFLCSFSVNSVMQRVFGIQPATATGGAGGGMGGLGQMFDSSSSAELPDPKSLGL